MMKFGWAKWGAVGLLIFLFSCRGVERISPPVQAKSGSGGMEYSHREVRKTLVGEGETACWIFEPADPTIRTAPVVVFIHGWTATNPKGYGGWIKHLVRRGNIVIYPRFQSSMFTSTQRFVPNAATGIQEAIECLKNGQHVRPDLNRFAIVGHSVGGAMTVNLAVLAKAYDLPEPRALMCVQPAWQLDVTGLKLPFEDLSKIPLKTFLLCVAGDRDLLVGQRGAYEIYASTSGIPLSRKCLIVINSDSHGIPTLQADHLSPLSLDNEFNDNELLAPTSFTFVAYDKLTTDALDYYGYWKLLDGLLDTAFSGKDNEYWHGNTPQVRCMGKWSDGEPVKELTEVLEEK